MLLFAFSCLLATTSCATLSGRKEILSIDSEPRGVIVEVPEAGDGFKATTPFFVELTRAKHHEFRLRTDDTTATEDISCRFRWFPTVLGNAGLAVATLAPTLVAPFLTYGVGLTVDFSTGAAWRCRPRIVLTSPSTLGNSMKPAERCDRLLLIPVGAEDPATAWDYETAWQNYRRKNPNGCERLVAHNEADEELGRYGFLQQESLQKSRKRLQKHALALGLATGATHFLLVSTADDETSGRLVAEKFDAHTMEKTEAPEWDREQWEKRSRAPNPLWRVTKSLLLKLVPNSFGAANGAVQFNNAEEKQVWTENFKRSLLLANIQHPAQYNQWDITFDWISGLSLQWLNVSSKATGRTSAIQADASLGAETTLHTLLGAFLFSLDIGALELFSRQRADSDWAGDGVSFYRLGQAFRAFPTEDLFVQIKAEETVLLQPLQTTEHRNIHSVFSAELGIGYYLPEIPLWLGRKL
jgi:hypothetical protein